MNRSIVLALAGVLAAAVFTLLAAPWQQARAQDNEVVIGVIYPLSGPVAQVGVDAVAAVDAAREIIHQQKSLNVPLAGAEGLPNLNNARIRTIVVDHQGKPEIGQSEAERLITQEGVDALFGAYYSSVTAAASQVAERHQVPFVNASSSSPKLTERGFKWFFRTGPHDAEFTQLMFDFMKDFEERNDVSLDSVGILHEDTLWGTDSGDVQRQMARDRGYEVANKISYRAQTTSLDSEVQRLKSAGADVFLPSSYTSDAMLFLRTAKRLDYTPPLLIAQNAGYTDPSFIENMGSMAEGVITRSPYNDDLAESIPLINEVNEIFKKHSDGRPLSDVPARVFTGFMTLADAINRAGSTEPAAIQQALRETDIPPEQLIVPWRGIRFGDNGHNELTRGILMQVQDGAYCTIYPFEFAACDVMYPMPGWDEKEDM